MTDTVKRIDSDRDQRNEVTRTDQLESPTVLAEGFVPAYLSKDPRAFPVEGWERYDFIKFIGEGGMGRVFKALDPKLNRHVALKFIRGDDPTLLQRFFREAQAQARIDHKNVCKIYEVGEVEGRPYIAMQYINGHSFKELKNQMSLEQKLRVMKGVCEGIHAAHRLGLIHRDIKPANIMIEIDPEGEPHPYVMDFGLVREVESKSETMTGVIMGTASYMSPEQANGETEKLDRRADVYSLGATLYELLGGRPPFVGTTNFEIVLKLIREDPEPLRKLEPRIPVDLETIVMKCLEREPHLRFDSARALEEDLQRWLDGDPIEARRASFLYWAVKKAKKHRTLVAVAAIILAVALAFGGIWFQERRANAERTRLAQQFGQEAEKMEGILRYAYMMPLHDVREEKTIVRLRMKSIEEQMRLMGSVGEGPGYYALGRGYLALHEYETARKHLEKIWNSGYQAPEVGYALGQAMGELYLKALGEAERIVDKDLRELQKKKIEEDYRLPALRYLKAGGKAQAESTAYVEGLIAFYEKHYEEALGKTRQAFDQVPWLYEAKRLEGDIYVETGTVKLNKGDYKDAMADYKQAEEAYKTAMDMARSDASVYESECGRCNYMMELGMRQGAGYQEAFNQLLDACDRALQADPESGGAYSKKAKAYFKWADYQRFRGEDPVAALQKAIESASQAVGINPRDTNAYNYIGNAYWSRGEYQIQRGIDPLKSLDEAVKNFQKAIEIDPNFTFAYNNMGNAYLAKGEYERSRGIEPRASLDKAIANFQKAIEIDPKFAYAYNNAAIALKKKGEYEMSRGEDPQPSFRRAIENYQKAIAINPNDADNYGNMAIAYEAKGEYELRAGLDPSESAEQAAANHKRSIEMNAVNASINMGVAYRIKGAYLLAKGIDPTAALVESRKAVQSAMKENPSDFEIYLRLGEIELIAARWAISQNESPKIFFDKALSALTHALKLNPQDAYTYRTAAELYRRRAEWRLGVEEKPLEEVKQGSIMAERALSVNGQMAEAEALCGAFQLFQAKVEQDGMKRIGLAQGAKKRIDEALKMNALLEREYKPLLNEADQLIGK